jgi:hypothetical protein
VLKTTGDPTFTPPPEPTESPVETVEEEVTEVEEVIQPDDIILNPDSPPAAVDVTPDYHPTTGKPLFDEVEEITEEVTPEEVDPVVQAMTSGAETTESDGPLFEEVKVVEDAPTPPFDTYSPSGHYMQLKPFLELCRNSQADKYMVCGSVVTTFDYNDIGQLITELNGALDGAEVTVNGKFIDQLLVLANRVDTEGGFIDLWPDVTFPYMRAHVISGILTQYGIHSFVVKHPMPEDMNIIERYAHVGMAAEFDEATVMKHLLDTAEPNKVMLIRWVGGGTSQFVVPINSDSLPGKVLTGMGTILIPDSISPVATVDRQMLLLTDGGVAN